MGRGGEDEKFDEIYNCVHVPNSHRILGKHKFQVTRDTRCFSHKLFTQDSCKTGAKFRLAVVVSFLSFFFYIE